MRIISGYLKGKKIDLPIDNNTRPLRDMVKESIFNIINHSSKIFCKIENANILDLFSGSGSFGLECISRGAGIVYFNENYLNALKILKKNIHSLECRNKVILIEKDCFKLDVTIKKFNQKFDLIFLDPPFKEEKINFLIDMILDLKILKKNGIIIVHRNKKDDQHLSKKINIIDTRNYGVSKIIFGN